MENMIETYRTINKENKAEHKERDLGTEEIPPRHEGRQKQDSTKEEQEKKSYHLTNLQTTGQQERFKTRLMTLNVYSIRNKKTAVEQYLRDNRVHVAVITETHVQEDGEGERKLQDYTLVNTCHRQKGETKGGIAIYVHIDVPCKQEYSKVVTTTNEWEHCAVMLFPNHTMKDQLQVVGVYRPPYK